MAGAVSLEKRMIAVPSAGPRQLEGRFAEIYRSNLSYVWHSLRRLSAPAPDLEDLTQEVFVRVLRALPDYDPDRPFRPWIFSLVLHTVLDFRKQRARKSIVQLDSELQARLQSTTDRPDEALEKEQHRGLVLRALADLNLKKRAVFVMVELNGHSVPEAAEALKLPLNTAYSRLRLARADFTEAIRRQASEEPR